MTNKGRPNGSRRIDPATRQRAIEMRRDEKKVLKEIAEETGISVAHLKAIFKEEGITIPYRRRYGTPRPNARKTRLGKKGNNGNTGKQTAKRAIVRDPDKPKVEQPKKRADISPVLAMQIEDRMRKRREAERVD